MIPDWLQWPAMAVTVVSSGLVASRHRRSRSWGFWLFLVSNALWIAWGIPNKACALVVLQFLLAGMNIRGVLKADEKQTG